MIASLNIHISNGTINRLIKIPLDAIQGYSDEAERVIGPLLSLPEFARDDGARAAIETAVGGLLAELLDLAMRDAGPRDEHMVNLLGYSIAGRAIARDGWTVDQVRCVYIDLAGANGAKSCETVIVMRSRAP